MPVSKKADKKKDLSKQLSKGSQIAFIGNGLSKVFSIGTKVIISRLMGPSGLGTFELVISLTRFASMTGQIGLHQTVVYYISHFRRNGEEDKIAAVIRSGFFVLGIVFTIVTLLMFLSRDQIKTVFFSNETPVIVITALTVMIVAFGLRNYLTMCYRGLKKITQEVFINQFAFYCIIVLSLGACYLIRSNITIHWLAILLIFSAVLSFSFSLPVLFTHLKTKISREEERTILKKMLIYGFPLWGNGFLNIGRAQLDRVMLGIFSNTSQIGFFAAGNTIAVILSFILDAFTPISQPLISEAYASSDFQQLNHIYRTLVRWGAIICIPLGGAFILFGEPLLAIIFGAEFSGAYLMLVFLVFGYTINVLAGPAGNMLIMTNHQRASLLSLLAGFIIAIGLHWFLIPVYQGVGAAVATGVSLAVTNVLRIFQVKHYLKISYEVATVVKISAGITASVLLVSYLRGFGIHLIFLAAIYTIMCLILLYFLVDIRSVRDNIQLIKKNK